MTIIHNFEQQTPEWFAARRGKMTASHAQAIGNVWKGLETYARKIVAEQFSSWEREQFSNEHTDRGNELEPIAIDMYELETGSKVEKIGFYEYNEYVGCSPDGIVWDKGLVEVKSLEDTKHFNLIIDGADAIDSGHIWQMQMQMLVTGREWCDYVAYNPNYKKSLCIFRIFPDLEMFEKLKKWFEVWQVMIERLKLNYNSKC